MTASSAAASSLHHINSRLLDGLTDRDRATVLEAGSTRFVSAHAVVAHQGQPGDRLYLITRGWARYFYITPEGTKIMLLSLPTGQIFGASALLREPREYLVSTEMVVDGSVLAWHSRAIRSLAERFPLLLENALSLSYDYLSWYVSAHTSLVCDGAEKRLARVLVTLADGIGHTVSSGVAIDLTNEQLANMANITLFTASRILTRWQRKGAIIKRRGQVLICDRKLLFRHDS